MQFFELDLTSVLNGPMGKLQYFSLIFFFCFDIFRLRSFMFIHSNVEGSLCGCTICLVSSSGRRIKFSW